MSRAVRIALGGLVGMVGCASLVAAQGAPYAATDWMGIISIGTGGGALIAWGVQTEKTRSHSRRLDKLEDDRVTRSEFMEMKQDIRQVLEMMERRRHTREP